MIHSGILNPQLASLLCRFRHTNTLVIADRGFPFWPQIETVDISLVNDLPKVTDVLKAVADACVIGRAWMADEFLRGKGGTESARAYHAALVATEILFEPHGDFKSRVPASIGLIRTGDVTPYANIILESA